MSHAEQNVLILKAVKWYDGFHQNVSSAGGFPGGVIKSIPDDLLITLIRNDLEIVFTGKRSEELVDDTDYDLAVDEDEEERVMLAVERYAAKLAASGVHPVIAVKDIRDKFNISILEARTVFEEAQHL